MYDNYHYPPGADNEQAPWNEPLIPEKDFEVTCSQSLSRTVTVRTDHYIPGASGVDYEYDTDGPAASSWHDDDDTSDTNWGDEYESNGYYTPLQLIQVLKEYLQKDLDNIEDIARARDTNKTSLEGKLRNLIEECEGWTEDETEFIEE